MKIVYIVHPIAGDVMENVGKIMEIVRNINLTEPEIVPFAPYLSDVLALNDEVPEERDRGMKNCTEVLQSGIVKELWIYGDRISRGMQEEIKLAFEMGLPITVKDPRIPDITFYNPNL